MSRAERAKEYFLQGYTCAQAVALAFADLIDADMDTVLKTALPFGGGLSRLRLTCGAVSGMAIVVGLIFAKTDISHENKMGTYAIVQELAKGFEEVHGSVICSELLRKANTKVEFGGEAEQRTAEYYKRRPCGDIVASAAQILEEYLQKRGLV